MDERKYRSAAFYDVQQAFDRVWLQGCIYKIEKISPSHFFLILKPYLSACIEIYSINAGGRWGHV